MMRTAKTKQKEKSKMTIKIPTMPFVIPERITFQSLPTVDGIGAMTISETSEMVKSMIFREDREDIVCNISDLHFSFNNQIATMKQKTGNCPMLLTKTAWNSLAGKILPRSGKNFVFETMKKDHDGQMLAGVNMNFWALGNETPVKLRTKLARVKGKHFRLVYGVLSPKYTAFDNVDYLNLLASIPEIKNQKVLSLKITDDFFRMRISDEKVREVHVPVNMLEAWNSESGKCSARIQAGIFRYICTNGMGSFDKKSEKRFNHVGNQWRIKTGIRSSLHGMHNKASHLKAQYRAALSVRIQEFGEWFRSLSYINKDFSEKQIETCLEKTKDPTSSPLGTLAGLIDGCTLGAQSFDIFDQLRMEKTASRVMAQGLKEFA
ncbi:MAG: hypothetical protein CMO80_21885 [Verrucomicrobiales bacterium]|nr:hypothetical protein [Verrucomicrobiales bacterium]